MIDCTPIVIRPRPNRTPATREFSPAVCFRAQVLHRSGLLPDPDVWIRKTLEARPDAACRPADSNIRPGTLLIPCTRYGPAACGTAGSAKPSKSTRSARPAPDPAVFGSGRAPAVYGPPTAAHACGPPHNAESCPRCASVHTRPGSAGTRALPPRVREHGSGPKPARRHVFLRLGDQTGTCGNPENLAMPHRLAR